MVRIRLIALGLLILGALVGYFVYTSQFVPPNKFPFKLGLDLAGGTHLVYRADVSAVAAGDVKSSMEALRDVVERRVNLFGVSEPLVQVEQAGVTGQGEERLIVELPGVTDVNQAVALIGKTPTLEFKLLRQDASVPTSTPSTDEVDQLFEATGLTGRLLQHAQLQFEQRTNEPLVTITFNSEGKALFESITKNNVGRILGIFLDGVPISTPVIREEIASGDAQISGGFTPDEAKELVRNLNYGALPVPIELASTQSVGASLGESALHASLFAGIWGFMFVALFLILWYRLPGLIAVLALIIYIIINLALFKLIPVTLTAAGLAAFILSMGMAVDANILIFERTKEELAGSKKLREAIHEGFARAWLSIRDSNLSSIITGVILFWLGGTAVIKGFALVFVIGVLVSMFTAITVTRTFLLALGVDKANSKAVKFLFGNGLSH